LSNGNYHVMVTNTGGGYGRWKTLALTRWREDSTCGNWGSFCYMEIVLGDPAADIAHPAFEKLFVETEILRDDQAILCKRRARTPEELTPWMFHRLIHHRTSDGHISYETDRMRFIGRGRAHFASG